MKAHKSLSTTIFVSIICLMVLASCANRELSAQDDCVIARNTRVMVLTDWEGTSQQKELDFFFYPVGGGDAIHAVTPETGFIGDLPKGTYQVLAFNADSVHTTLSGTDRYATARVRVNDARPNTRVQERYVDSPDNLYVFHLAELAVDKNEVTTILTPDSLTHRLVITVKSPQNMLSLSAEINGAVTERLLYNSGGTGTERGILRLSAGEVQQPTDTLYMQRRILGFNNPKGSAPYRCLLSITARLEGEDEDAPLRTITADAGEVIARLIDESEPDKDRILHSDIQLRLKVDFNEGTIILRGELAPWQDNPDIPAVEARKPKIVI